MKSAIISDIHGNLEALEAVLADIKRQEITEIISLGDIIGYGPNPYECLKLVQEYCKVSVKGNHEQAVLYIDPEFQVEASRAVDWTRDELNSARYEPAQKEKFWDYLRTLARVEEADGILYLHGSPRDAIREYLRPNDVYNWEKMQENFGLTRQVCFCGHTHEPGVFVPQKDKTASFYKPVDLQNVYQLDGNKCIINVGSVGQPRDNDNRACYLVVEDKKVTFHRVAYDYHATAHKILATGVLPKILAARLTVGK